MNKHKRIDKELDDIYNDLSPQKIHKIVSIKLKEKINQVPSNKNNEHQGKILAHCLNKYPFAYFMGYVDTLEEMLMKQNPDIMEEIIMDPQIKADLADKYGEYHAQIIFELAGAVDSIDILKLIETARENDFSQEKLIQNLENLVEAARNRDMKK